MVIAYIAFIIGLVLLVLFAADRYLILSSVEADLRQYLSDAREVVRIADDPRVTIHYKAVVTTVSGILSKYFSEE